MIRLRIPSRTGECNQTQLISFFPAVRNQEREAPLNHLHLIHQLSICQPRESCQRNPVSLQKKKTKSWIPSKECSIVAFFPLQAFNSRVPIRYNLQRNPVLQIQRRLWRYFDWTGTEVLLQDANYLYEERRSRCLTVCRWALLHLIVLHNVL